MDNCKVFVGGLSYNTTEDDLKKFFEDNLKDNECIINLRIVKDHETNKSRGFAFVSFISPEFKEKAIELDGVKLDGRFIGIKTAVNKKKVK